MSDMSKRDYPQEMNDAKTGAGKASVVSDWLRDVGPGEANVARKQQTPNWQKKQDPRR